MSSKFEYYLRTGRRSRSATPIEIKFNAWHDPEDGRFTYAGQGRYFPGGRGRTPPGARSNDGGRPAGAGIGGRQSGINDPKNSANYSHYIVKRGDTLTKIAGLRNGLTVADLEWLNDLGANAPLRIGQRIKLPHQQFLDAGKRARDTFLALAHYISLTGGKLPPNVARPPSIAMQVEASGRREFHANGYRYEIDMLLRTRHVTAEIGLKSESRSRSAQANAGKPDRRTTDDGGHFIAARFNGPRKWFNHFAQDANFNRGAYRALENRWADAIGSGQRVFVDIVPEYRGTSMRPFRLIVTSIIDGNKRVEEFPNEKQGRRSGDR